MTLPNVETFEHDIATEIIKKESTISKINSAENLVADVTKEVAPTKATTSSSAILIEIVIVVVLLIGVGGYFGYTYFIKEPVQPIQLEQKQTTPALAKNSFAAIFPDLNDSLGRFVTRLDKNPYGFAITVSEYKPVFSYTVKNEQSFASSIARVLPTGISGGEIYTFTDITIANQNMRIGTSGSSTVAYAFVGTNKLIISTSTEGLSAIASGIIK